MPTKNVAKAFMDKKLQEMTASYDVRLNTSKNPNGKDVLVEIIDGHNELLEMTVQYSDGEIYCVYFLNNQYFEEKAEVLYKVLDAILVGEYEVVSRGIFQKRRYINVKLKAKIIGPERTTNDEEFETIYKLLPIAFTKADRMKYGKR